MSSTTARPSTCGRSASGDAAALRELLAGLSVESRAFRFFSGAVDLERAAAAFADVDYGERYGLVAIRGGERIVGHGLYVGGPGGRAEVAFAVAEEMQGHGLGTILLAHLAEVAGERGYPTFVANVLPQNHRMIEMFRESGLATEITSEPGVLRVEMPTSFSAAARERFEDRDRRAARAAVASVLEPRSVALVGASRRQGSVGGEVLRNLVEAGFAGVLYPVNPGAEELRAAAGLSGPFRDPRRGRAGGDRGAGGGGRRGRPRSRGEGGAGAGRPLRRLRGDRRRGGASASASCWRSAAITGCGWSARTASASSTRPRGRASTPPSSRIRRPPATLASSARAAPSGWPWPSSPRSGGLGVSSFASVGNRADVTGNDLLEFWEDDGRTEVALLYIESFSDPRRFSRVARRAGRKLPIVAVKSGRSAAGARAASSHTGALLAASDRTVDALFAQSGVVRTETLEEMLDVAAIFSSQPLPAGRRVGIVTNAGGPGIMCADACESAGLEVPETPPAVWERLPRSRPRRPASPTRST